MKRNVAVVRGCIENGIFKAFEETRKVVPFYEALQLKDEAKELIVNHLEKINGKANMWLDHIVAYAEVYGKRGGLKEVHIIDKGRDIMDVDFEKFIKPYGYVLAYHK